MRPDRLARLHRAVDGEAGERIRVIPYTAGGILVGGPDPDRPPVEIVAPVSAGSKVSRTKGPGANTGRNAELRLGAYTAKVAAADLPWPVAEGFHVVLLDRGDLELKVNGADPGGTGRTVLRLEPLPPRPAKP